jgi:hypothetical protein
MKEGFLQGQGWMCLKGGRELQVSSSVQRVAAKGFDVLDPAEDSLADGVTPAEKNKLLKVSGCLGNPRGYPSSWLTL